MALAEQATLVATLKLNDKMSAGVKSASTTWGKLNASFARTSQAMGKAAHNFKLLGLAAVGGLVAAVKWATDFEAGMNTINTVAKVTPARLAKIGGQIRELGATTGTAFNDLQAAYYDIVSAGIDASQAQNVLTQANKLAIGGLGTTSEAVDLLTTAINAYGGNAQKAAVYTDMLAQAVAAGKVKTSELAASFSTVALIAANYGIGANEIAAAYANLTAQGDDAGEVATKMRSAITALLKPTAALTKLQKDQHANYLEMAKDKGLVFTWNEIREAADRQGVAMADLAGRVEAQSFIVGTTGAKWKAYKKDLDAVNESHKGGGEAAKQMAERQKGLLPALNRLKNNFKDIAITLGTALLPPLAEASDALSEFFRTHGAEVKKFADQLSTIFGGDDGKQPQRRITGDPIKGRRAIIPPMPKTPPLVEGLTNALGFLKGLPWGPIGQGMQLLGQATKSIVDGFKSLPPGMQTALIALLAANKLTGGLITSVGKDILGLALSSLKSITAGVVNLISPRVNGLPGGSGVVPAGGGIAGLLGAGVKGITAVTAVGGVAAMLVTGASLLIEAAGGQKAVVDMQKSWQEVQVRYWDRIGVPPKDFRPGTQGSMPPNVQALVAAAAAESARLAAAAVERKTFDRFGIQRDYAHGPRPVEMPQAGGYVPDWAAIEAALSAGRALGEWAQSPPPGWQALIDRSKQPSVDLLSYLSPDLMTGLASLTRTAAATTAAVKGQRTVVNLRTSFSVSAREIASEVQRVVVGNRVIAS